MENEVIVVDSGTGLGISLSSVIRIGNRAKGDVELDDKVQEQGDIRKVLSD